MTLSANHVCHARTKHVVLDLNFVQDKVLVGKLLVLHILSEEQHVDVLTKPLTVSQFNFLCIKLNGCH